VTLTSIVVLHDQLVNKAVI